MTAEIHHLHPCPRTATDYAALYVAECARWATVEALMLEIVVEAGGESSYWGGRVAKALRGEGE